MLGKLQHNETASNVTVSGLELGPVRAKILSENIAKNKSLRSLSLTHKQIEDEEGLNFAKMLLVNSYVRKVEFEGNKLGPKTALALAHVLEVSDSLQFLDLSRNCLTSQGDDPDGVFALAEALKTNTSLLSLGVAGNMLDESVGQVFEEAIKENYSLIDFDYQDNHFSVNCIRNIQTYLRRNKQASDAAKMTEFTERKYMREEEAQTKQMNLEQQADQLKQKIEEDELDLILEETMRKMSLQQASQSHERALLTEQLCEAAAIRAK